MESQPTLDTIKIQEIFFSNGNRALAVIPPRSSHTTSLVHALGIPQSGSLIMIAGGAAQMDERDNASLVRLFGDGIAHFAATQHALVIDGGTQSGVMELMGQGAAQQSQRPVLLGISPAENVTYPGKISHRAEEQTPLDPNHSHFVLVDSNEWGGETETMYELANIYSQSCPSVAILVNGGEIARNEVLYNVRQGRPIIVFEGSGRLADEIVEILHNASSLDTDLDLTEIMNQGKLNVFPITGSTEELEQLIQRMFDEQQ